MQTNDQRGFTIIELMLAMVFMATLLMLATLLFIQSINTYNKGISYRQISQTGQNLSSDLAIATVDADLFQGDSPSNGSVVIFCIDKTAYVMNPRVDGTNENGKYQTDAIKFTNGQQINMARTREDVNGESYCTAPPAVFDENQFENLIGTQISVREATIVPLTEMVNGVEKKNGLVRVSITIGTSSDNGGRDPEKDASGNWTCPPDDIGAFCAVSTYNTTIFMKRQG